MVPVDASTNYCMDPKRAIEMVDEVSFLHYTLTSEAYSLRLRHRIPSECLSFSVRFVFVSLTFSLLVKPAHLTRIQTYTGHYENVQEMADLLDEYEKKTGIDIPIHVDGASGTLAKLLGSFLCFSDYAAELNNLLGAMFAPFASPSLVWDFRIKRVSSINTSGHSKFLFDVCPRSSGLMSSSYA